jgi:hypothetical protein
VTETDCPALPTLHSALEFLAAFPGRAADGFAGFLRTLADFLTDLLGTLANVMDRGADRITRALGTVL